MIPEIELNEYLSSKKSKKKTTPLRSTTREYSNTRGSPTSDRRTRCNV